MMTKLEIRARDVATCAHLGQTRKYTGDPYIVHPATVADLVRAVPHTDEMIAAAWLHDVVEDTTTRIQTIYDMFGTVVGDLVRDLTDVSRLCDGNRSIRKGLDRDHTAQASADAQTIKL